MSYIYAVTSLQLKQAQMDAIVHAVSESNYVTPFRMAFKQYSPEFCAGLALDQITFFLCVPSEVSVEQRRAITKLLNDTMVSVVGHKGDFKVIVIFWPYEDGDALVDGRPAMQTL